MDWLNSLWSKKSYQIKIGLSIVLGFLVIPVYAAAPFNQNPPDTIWTTCFVDTLAYEPFKGSESDLKAEVKEKYPELYRIIECESHWRTEVCNVKYGCESGMGLAQIIPRTWQYIQDQGVKVDNPFDFEDNLTAAIWLYSNEGNSHWLMSRHCWDK